MTSSTSPKAPPTPVLHLSSASPSPLGAPPAPPRDLAPRWSSYVALGDSFTEGLWDPYPDTDCQRGWADRFAEHLSARRVAAGAEPLRYANLAIRGRLLRSILAEQVPAALARKPDLVSLTGGGNDILRPGADVVYLAGLLERAVMRLRAAGIDVLLSTGYDAAHSPLVSLTRGKTGMYNAYIWSMARRHGAYVLDLWGMRSLGDWRMWAQDRIHPTPSGHARVAQAALVAVGLLPDDDAWDDPLVPLAPAPVLDRVREHARWARAYAVPWVGRRLTGRSSGDGRLAKYPALEPFPAT